jgi:tetratricopeptide (TPR) repeat protein
MIINADLSLIYLYARRYDEAEAQARKALEIDSRSFVAHYYLGMALQLRGRLKEAIPEFQKAVELNHDPYSVAMLAQAYARNRETDEARKLLTHLNEMAKSADVPEYALALAYTSLGEKEHAIEALERSYNGGNRSYLFLLPVDPMLDDLRGDPRFEALVQKITAPKPESKQ